MISLFDYLGKAAGLTLGQQVNQYARMRKAKYSIRAIRNTTYEGNVTLYKREFLDEFFKVKSIFNS